VTTNAEEVWIKINGVLAEVYNGQFVANHVPLTEGDNKIIANATDSNGAVGRAEVSVKANITAPHITLNANITSGVSPLTSYFTVTTEIPNAVTTYQMDFEGDGTIDYTGSTFEDIFHTYTTEGIYYPTVIITDDKGNTYTDVIGIVVVNRGQIDGLLKGKWMSMTNSLIVKDIATALTFIASGSRSAYEQMFNALYDQLPSITETQRELNLIYIADNIAKYRLVTFENNKFYSYEVTFVKDAKGAWKILQY
jgi:hypothetical protein